MRSKTLGAPPASHEGHGPDDAAPEGRSLGVFRNTYYFFPSEADFSGPTATLFDAACGRIAQVPRGFHDALCVQGSGLLAQGRTVAFARRDCACADVCPRSGQRICYELLDRAKFPWGRGASGRPIAPFRSLAVDPGVVPLGTRLYIPRFAGAPVPGGGVHDGCFVAEDRGLRVTGRTLDIFGGAESTAQQWNRLVPTGSGVEVFVEEPRCDAASR
jgi:3D (Asp-Asp-Asp) domain-containing protein